MQFGLGLLFGGIIGCAIGVVMMVFSGDYSDDEVDSLAESQIYPHE